MEIIEADEVLYKKVIPIPYHVFNTADFGLLNQARCEQLLFLLFKDNKYRMGLMAGIKGNEIHTPFSAPFGGFSFVSEDISLSQIDACTDALEAYAAGKQYATIHYTMPPLFYKPVFNNKMLNVLYRKNFALTATDLNYQFDLRNPGDPYESNIWYNARKNLRIAQQQGFSFNECTDEDAVKDAYEVIKENRSRKGYPLKMTYEQVKQTTQLIKADFFLLTKATVKVAAAQVFHVAEGIVQVIYWGDIPDFTPQKPMNYLAYKIFTHYQQRGFNFIDIGPSTENSIPNYGLCEFKESIGCSISAKFTFTKQLAV